MIAAIRRIRQKLGAAVTSWMPAQEVTRLTLRPMPWELDRAGQPTAAFLTHIADLAARGWCSDSGTCPGSVTGKPQLRSHSGQAPLKPFGRLLVATQLSSFGGDALILSHLLCMASGEIVGSLTTRVPLSEAAPAEPAAIALPSTIAPAQASGIARAA